MLLAEAFLTPAHSAVFSQYGFAIYRIVTQATGARCIEVPALAAPARMPLGHDLAAMSACDRARTRALVFVANPNNPTGTWAPPAAVKALLERAPPSTLVLLDEAYLEYGRERGTQDGLRVAAPSIPNLVIVRTFSKAYGLAGARVGYAVSHPEVAETLNRLRPAFNVNSVAQAGAAAALADQAHMRADGRGDAARSWRASKPRCSALGLWCAPSACNFLLVHVGARPAHLSSGLLQRRIDRAPASAATGCGEYLRVSIGLPQRERSAAARAARAVAMSGAPTRRYLVRPGRAASRAQLRVPGDKSISHRALMLGGIADGRTDISGFLASEDCLATLAALRALGVAIERPERNRGARARRRSRADCARRRRRSTWAMPARPCGCSWDCWPASRSTARSIGDASLMRRPMERVAQPLRRMGAQHPDAARAGRRSRSAAARICTPSTTRCRSPARR